MTNEIGEDETATGGRPRAGVKIAIATFALALAGAGVYAVVGGGSPEATAAGNKTSASKADTKKADTKKADDKKEIAKPSASPSPSPKPSKAPELPSAKNMTKGEKRAALIAYLEKGNFPLTDDSSPASAAKGACDLLDGGMKRDKLVSELSREAEVSEKLGGYFLIGATHFYCPTRSVSS